MLIRMSLVNDLDNLLEKDKNKIIKWLDVIKTHKSEDDTIPHLLNNSKIPIKTKKQSGVYNRILIWLKANMYHFKDYDFTGIPESNHTTMLEIQLAKSPISPISSKKTFKTEVDVKRWKANPTIHPITGVEMNPVSEEYAKIYEKAYKIMKSINGNIQLMLPSNHCLFGDIDLLYYKMKDNKSSMLKELICTILTLNVELKIQKDNILETEIEFLKNLFSDNGFTLKIKNFSHSVYTTSNSIIWNYINDHMNDMVSALLVQDFDYKISTIDNIINHEGEPNGKNFIYFVENNKLYNNLKIIDYLKQSDNESWTTKFLDTYNEYKALYDDIDKLLDKNSGIIENYENEMFNLISDPLDKYFKKYEDALTKIKNPKFSRLIDLSTFKPVKTNIFLNDEQFEEFNIKYAEKEIEYNKLKKDYENELKIYNITRKPKSPSSKSPKSTSSPKPPKRPTISYGEGLKYIFGNIRPLHISNDLLKDFNKEYDELKDTLEEYNKVKNMSYATLVKKITKSSLTSPIKRQMKNNELFSMTRKQIKDNILFKESASLLKDRCSESKDILTNDEFDDDNYPLAALQLMVRLKTDNKTECIYAPALYNFLVNCANNKTPFINPITRYKYTPDDIEEVMKVMKVIDKNMVTPKYLKVVNDTKLLIDFEEFPEDVPSTMGVGKLNFFEIYIYRKFGNEDQPIYDLCIIPADIDSTGIFGTGSNDLTSSVMLFRIQKLFNDGRLLSKYVPPYYNVLKDDDNNEYFQYVELGIHFNRYKTVDDWMYDNEEPVSKEQFINKFKHYAEEINSFIY
jgi:hypothetical protein